MIFPVLGQRAGRSVKKVFGLTATTFQSFRSLHSTSLSNSQLGNSQLQTNLEELETNGWTVVKVYRRGGARIGFSWAPSKNSKAQLDSEAISG